MMSFMRDLTAFRQNLIKFTNSALWKILVLGAFVPTCSDDNTTLLAARTLGPPVLWDPLHDLAVQFYDRSVWDLKSRLLWPELGQYPRGIQFIGVPRWAPSLVRWRMCINVTHRPPSLHSPARGCLHSRPFVGSGHTSACLFALCMLSTQGGARVSFSCL